MTFGARRREHARAGCGVGGEGRPLLEPRACGGRRRYRHAARQKREIGDDVPHVRSGRIERPPVHAAAEAIIDAVLERLDDAAARTILRIPREHPDPRAGLAAPFVEVTGRAPQLVAHVARQAVTCRGHQRAPSPDRVAVGA